MNNSNYEDIINLPHYEPKHPRMDKNKRAAQFAPFSALTGFETQIKETARLTSKRIELDDTLKETINIKLNKLDKVIKQNPEVKVTYFVPDKKKNGGNYITENGYLKKIDFINRLIKFTNNKTIIIDEIINIINNTETE